MGYIFGITRGGGDMVICLTELGTLLSLSGIIYIHGDVNFFSQKRSIYLANYSRSIGRFNIPIKRAIEIIFHRVYNFTPASRGDVLCFLKFVHDRITFVFDSNYISFIKARYYSINNSVMY